MTFYIRPLDHDVLLALAWGAPFTTAQLRRLVAPTTSRRAFSERLSRLRSSALIQGAWHYRMVAGKPPEAIGWVWSLTRAGFGMLEGSGQAGCGAAPAAAAPCRAAALAARA